MSLSSSSPPDPLNPLAEEFVARYRRGERPSLTEYTERSPALADQIRTLFPALVLMEQEGSVKGQATGPDLQHTPDDGPLPRQLGEYRILREVGRGGMGIVYEAVQESLGRHVALKVLPLHGLASPTHLERFRREAKAAARLHHTNIVPVHGVGEHAGVHYYAMQFIQGQGLEVVLQEVKRLRGGPEGPAGGGPNVNQEVAAGVAQGLLTGRFQLGEPEAADHPCPRAEPHRPAPRRGHGPAPWCTAGAHGPRGGWGFQSRRHQRLWNVATGEVLVTQNTPELLPHVFSVAFSPDGTQVAIGGWSGGSGSAWLWDVAKGQKLQRLQHVPAGPVFAVTFSPAGKILLTGHAGNAAQLWDAATGTNVHEALRHSGPVSAVAFSPDGKTVLTGSTDNAAQLWDVATGKRLGRPLEHPGPVYAVAFSPDGETILTGSRDGKARLWDTATGKLLGRPLPHPGPVHRVAFWYDGKAVLTAAMDPDVPFVGPETSARFWRVPAPLEGDARQLELWVQVVTGMELEANGAARLLDAHTWQERRQQLEASGFSDPSAGRSSSHE